MENTCMGHDKWPYDYIIVWYFPKNNQQDDVSLGLAMDNVNTDDTSLCPCIVALSEL